MGDLISIKKSLKNSNKDTDKDTSEGVDMLLANIEINRAQKQKEEEERRKRNEKIKQGFRLGGKKPKK